jgi:starvation-inducible outer membrane lipoprotein
MRRCLWQVCLLFWPVVGWCASPVPTELYAAVDHALRPEAVLAEPAIYSGRILLLGGRVERTVSEVSQVTLELVGYRLDDNDRPVEPDPALGRLLVRGTELDSALLQPGRLVTVVGQAAGRAAGDAGMLPQFESLFLHPWPTAAEEEAARASDWPCGCCGDPWYDPWRDPWYYGPCPGWRFGAGYYWHRY